MDNFKRKFDLVVERTLHRFQQHGFLNGDYVKLKPNALNHDFFKSSSEQMKAMVRTLQEQDNYLRISCVKSQYPGQANGTVGGAEGPECYWADVYTEHAPGMWSNPMTLPMDILEKIDISDASGYAQYPDSIKRKENLEAGPIKNDDLSSAAHQQYVDTHNLTTKNHTLQNSPLPQDGRNQTKINASKEIKMADDKQILAEIWEKKILTENTDIIDEVNPYEELTIEEGKQVSSILQSIIDRIYEAPDLESARHLAIETIKNSKIRDMSKRKMLYHIAQQQDLLSLQKYLTNSMLKQMGMGVTPKASYGESTDTSHNMSAMARATSGQEEDKEMEIIGRMKQCDHPEVRKYAAELERLHHSY
jgi:hypothetical protein